jgi:GntR family transcriptional regulator
MVWKGSPNARGLIGGQLRFSIQFQDIDVLLTQKIARTIAVNTPTKFEIDALRLPPHASTLLLRMVVSDGENVPIEYMRSVNHPAHVIFQAT